MNSAVLKAVFVVVTLCSPSFQQPSFFKNPFSSPSRKRLSASSQENTYIVTGDRRVVYYHDQTVAVVDLGPGNELHNCDLIEVFETNEALEVSKTLSIDAAPQLVTFKEMMKLMQQCEEMDKLKAETTSGGSMSTMKKRNRISGNPFSLLSGILPGTKWCGPGDIAETYHDLGREAAVDRCCRAHDLCPVKVRSQQSRYNLTNYSLYTKSHCTCDDRLYKCLKSANLPTANILGQIYFNVIKVPCVESVSVNYLFSVPSTLQFSTVKMSY